VCVCVCVYRRLSAVLVLCSALVGGQAVSAPVEVCIGLVLPLTSVRHVEAQRIVGAVHLAAMDANKADGMLPHIPIHIIDNPVQIDS
jgi:hypothetical protein